MRKLAVPALFALSFVFAALPAVRTAADGPGEPARRPQQIGLFTQAIIPFVGRDAFPDVAVQSLIVTTGGKTDVTYLFRISNLGDADAEFSRFTIQAWFSRDPVLDKAEDLPGSILGGATLLRPGDVFEATTMASNVDADDQRFPWVIVEVDSAGAVLEATLENNVLAVRRPPPDLVERVEIAWDAALSRAIVSWAFNGEPYGLPDLGFRVEVPGFGTQTVPAGTRSVVVRFDPLTGARPCLAKVSPLTVEGYAWPAVASNDLCDEP